MKNTQLKAGMLVLLWIGGRKDSDPSLVMLDADPESEDGVHWYARAGKNTVIKYPVEWMESVASVQKELTEVLVNYPGCGKTFLANVSEEEVPEYLKEDPDEFKNNVDYSRGFMPFCLLGDLDKFESYYLSALTELLNGDLIHARNLLSSIWNFGNGCWTAGYKTPKGCLNSTEALFAFASWLSVRDEEITFSAHHSPARVVELLEEFIEVQVMPEVREDFDTLCQTRSSGIRLDDTCAEARFKRRGLRKWEAIII